MVLQPKFSFIFACTKLAIIYFLLGLAGLQLAVPPGFSSPIFPAAGIAVAMILHYGYRLWPGVWLGSFSINLWVAGQQADLSIKVWLIAAAIGVGSSLQAILATSLVRQRVITWRKLELGREIIRFLILTGPIACLCSASWGNTVLVSSGAIPAHEFLFSWWNWWIGDTIGVLLFAPMTLMILQGEQPLWRERLTQVALPTLATAASMVLVFAYVANNETNQFKRRIEANGQMLLQHLQTNVLTAQELLDSLRHFIEVTPRLNADIFSRFSEASVIDKPALLALSWNPLIRESERASFERSMGEEHAVNAFPITEHNSKGQLQVATQREQYIPTRFISPLQNNRDVLGFDIASDTHWHAAMEAASRTGQIVSTLPIRLIQGDGKNIGVLLLHPVFQPPPIAAESIQTQTLIGFAVAAFQINDIFAHYLNHKLDSGLLVSLEDKKAPYRNRWLFHSGESIEPHTSRFLWQNTLSVADRDWQLSVFPSATYLANKYSPVAWIVLASGLILTSVLQAYLLTITGRAAQAQRRVQRQTSELARKEKFLRLSQSSGGIGTWEMDLINHRQSWSDNCFGFLGLSAEKQPSWEDFLQRVHPEDRPKLNKAIQAHIDHSLKFDIEYRVLVNDKEYWLHSSGQVERNNSGQPCVMRGILHDVTEAYHNRQQIIQLLGEQKAILENRLVGIVTLRKNRIIWANATFETMLGYQPGELIGKTINHLHVESSSYSVMSHAYRLLAQQKIVRTQLKLNRKDGQPIWLDMNGSPLHKTLGDSLWICIDSTERKHFEAALIQKEGYQRALLDSFPFRIWLKDTESRFLAVNQALARALGEGQPDSLVGKTDFDYSAPAIAEASRLDDIEVLHSLHKKTQEQEHINDLGERCWIETYKAPVLNDFGEPLGTVGFSRDISERKRQEIDLRIAATVFESQEGMLVTDANNTILRVNRSFCRITGYQPEEAIGQNPQSLLCNQQDPAYFEAMWERISQSGVWEGEFWSKRKSGERYPVALSITAVRDDDKRISHYVGTMNDITQRKAAAEEIERLAFYDPLTGLPNRRLLQDRLKLALAANQRNRRHSALLFIDLDNFKTLNDTLGHDMGDLLLKQVAQRLKECVREMDSVARLGGDEFVVMLKDLDPQDIEAAKQAEIIGNKILLKLNQPFQLADHDYHSTPSIGATLFDGHHKTSDELLKQADIAMYQAKNSGRNALRFFDPQMQETLNLRVRLEQDLRQALAESQFELYYQPQVDHERHIVGAESLIRWHHPERGILGPNAFIPLAEETGLILPIGQWVLEKACAQLNAWQNQPNCRNWHLAVNVSARQFRQPDFVDQVQQALRQARAEPQQLKMELTESLVLHDIEDSIQKMRRLRELGVRFSMDDFGTGYSSLSSLKRLPIDQLKIDQSFIHELISNPDDAVIVQTIIAMAKNLSMDVIAEGVETEEQRLILSNYDCSTYQGYLFSKPLPLAQFEANYVMPACPA